MPPQDWPESVPVLVADDVLLSDDDDQAGDRRTLSLWVRLSFSLPDQRDAVIELLTAKIAAALGRRKPAGYYELSWPGDGVELDPAASPERMAMAWNATMRELGYDAPDPKPKRKKPAKRTMPKDIDFFED